jgi:hypothetical protein
MANHSMATKSKSNSHMEEMTEEVASKTEVVDDSEVKEEIAEEAIKEEEALMAPEETLETDPEAASTVENKVT